MGGRTSAAARDTTAITLSLPVSGQLVRSAVRDGARQPYLQFGPTGIFNAPPHQTTGSTGSHWIAGATVCCAGGHDLPAGRAQALLACDRKPCGTRAARALEAVFDREAAGGFREGEPVPQPQPALFLEFLPAPSKSPASEGLTLARTQSYQGTIGRRAGRCKGRTCLLQSRALTTDRESQST